MKSLLFVCLLTAAGVAGRPDRAHLPFDLSALEKPSPRKGLLIFKPIEMAVSAIPKFFQMKPFMVPKLIGGDLTIRLPNIKNPTVINEFPTTQYLEAPPANVLQRGVV